MGGIFFVAWGSPLEKVDGTTVVSVVQVHQGSELGARSPLGVTIPLIYLRCDVFLFCCWLDR